MLARSGPLRAMRERLFGHEGCGGGCGQLRDRAPDLAFVEEEPHGERAEDAEGTRECRDSGPVNTGPVPVEMPQRTKVSDGV